MEGADMTEVTYEIPAENLGGLMAKLAKLSKKSVKINGTAIDLQVISEDRRPVFTTNIAGVRVPMLDDEGHPCFDIFYNVSVTGVPQVKIAGYTFVATIDHSPDTSNILRVSPSVTCDIPVKYRTVGPVCDHCQKIRSRRDTYLLQNDATGELKQIGRQCVRDFIGYDVDRFLALAEINADSSPFGGFDEDWIGGMGDRKYIFVRTYMAHVSAVSRAFGFVTRKDVDAGKSGSTTAGDALLNMFPPPSPKFKRIPLIQQDFDQADAAIVWASNMVCKGDFDLNMQALATSAMMEGRNTGTAAYILPAFLRFMERDFSNKARKASLGLTESQYVSTDGTRLRDIKATVYGYTSIANEFGGSTIIYRFLTDDGNVLVWFSSTGSVDGLGSMCAVDRTPVTITGTVKRHSEYQGVKQTTLNRCKVEIAK